MAENKVRPNYDKWREYVRTLTGRYKGRVKRWEIWNEPDLTPFGKFSVDEYVEMMRIAYEECKKIDPSIVVMSGGFASIKTLPTTKPGFHRNAIDRGRKYFDIHAYHEHCNFSSFKHRVDEMFIPMRKELNITQPWYADETAISSSHIGEFVQAETLYKKLIWAWSRGAVGYNWYNLRNKGFDPKNGEHNYGMLTYDFYPKAVYVVFNTMVNIFKPMHFNKELKMLDNIYALQFSSTGESAVANWKESPNTSADETVIFKTKSKNVEVIDLMGNASPPASIYKNIILHTIKALPMTLYFKGDGKPEYLGSLIKARVSGIALPGSSFDLNIDIYNPMQEELQFKIEYKLPKEFNIGQKSKISMIKPGSRLKILEKINVSSNFKPSASKNKFIKLKITEDKINFQTEFEIPVDSAIIIPATKQKGQWDFIIADHRHVVDLFSADPSNVDKLWKGKDDLSAKVALDRTDDALLITVDVTDDKHFQPYSGISVWKGDNVQIGLAVPEQKQYWEIGASLLDSGKSETFVWSSPSDFDSVKSVAMIKADITRKNSTTNYKIEIPFKAIGVNRSILKKGIRFNLLVNDNDSFGRERWIRISEGIGAEKKIDRYPVIKFE